GDAALRLTLSKVSLAREAKVGVLMGFVAKQVLGALSGVWGRATLTSRGQLTDLEFVSPRGEDPKLARLLERLRGALGQASLPLPVEAIGVGAQWRAARRSTREGVVSSQEVIFELTSLEGDAGRCALMTKQSTQGQPGPRAKTEEEDLLSIESEGRGD